MWFWRRSQAETDVSMKGPLILWPVTVVWKHILGVDFLLPSNMTFRNSVSMGFFIFFLWDIYLCHLWRKSRFFQCFWAEQMLWWSPYLVRGSHLTKKQGLRFIRADEIRSCGGRSKGKCTEKFIYWLKTNVFLCETLNPFPRSP